jgi:hypothetical protein
MPVGYRNSGRGLVFVDQTPQRVQPANFRGPQDTDRPLAVDYRSASEDQARDVASPRCSA